MAGFFGNATYSTFSAFSALRLFSPVESNITDVTFTLPGSPTTPAYVTGFGAVFSDVDLADTTSIEFFDLSGAPLIASGWSVPTSPGGLSFLGVIFDAGEQIGRVRITTGNTAPGPNESGVVDVVMMDDFLYSEPQTAIPEPTSMLLVGASLAGLVSVVRKRRSASA
jgi:hypothetical protein